MRQPILYFIGLIFLLTIPLISVGLIHLSRAIITPNELFFELEIGEIPKIEKDDWTLTITGAVENELIFNYENLTQMESVKLVATLECVDGPFGTAEWEGIPLVDVLEMAGLLITAKDLLFYAADSYSDSLNIIEASADNILLAFKMNGVDLPPSHGFPIRLVCPDHYGYKWVKWIVKIEAVEYDYIGFWESRGWSDNAMRTNFTFWITHAYLFCFAFILGGLAYISGQKSIPQSDRYKTLPEFLNRQYHLIFSLSFISFSLISFMYWVYITIIFKGGVFYSIHGIFGLITISILVLGGISGFSKRTRIHYYHQRISKVAWYLFFISILIGWVISVMGTLRINQILFPWLN
jgi:hypothetical protein